MLETSSSFSLKLIENSKYYLNAEERVVVGNMLKEDNRVIYLNRIAVLHMVKDTLSDYDFGKDSLKSHY